MDLSQANIAMLWPRRKPTLSPWRCIRSSLWASLLEQRVVFDDNEAVMALLQMVMNWNLVKPLRISSSINRLCRLLSMPE
jgi:hypothetical protein